MTLIDLLIAIAAGSLGVAAAILAADFLGLGRPSKAVVILSGFGSFLLLMPFIYRSVIPWLWRSKTGRRSRDDDKNTADKE